MMIDSLAKYFRLSLNKGNTIVSVTDELRLAEVYLEIQQSRFLGSFDFKVAAGDELEAYRMPKLILRRLSRMRCFTAYVRRRTRRDLSILLWSWTKVISFRDFGQRHRHGRGAVRRLLTEERVGSGDHSGNRLLRLV